MTRTMHRENAIRYRGPGTMATGLAILAAIGLAVLASPVAHADDAGYLAELQAHGVPTGFGTTPLPAGYSVCAQLRAGETPGAAAGQFGWANAWGPQIVAAAQHNLCPDTLR